jgi:hypothetical protein
MLIHERLRNGNVAADEADLDLDVDVTVGLTTDEQ